MDKNRKLSERVKMAKLFNPFYLGLVASLYMSQTSATNLSPHACLPSQIKIQITAHIDNKAKEHYFTCMHRDDYIKLKKSQTLSNFLRVPGTAFNNGVGSIKNYIP